jgi:oligopeptide/dipeptide ABC transporter ATP-binding protein
VNSEDTPSLLRVEGLCKSYLESKLRLLGRSRRTHAVRNLSFKIAGGETFAVMGESGAGKSTLCRLVMQLERPDGGRVFLGNRLLTGTSPRRLRRQRRWFQAVFQDPWDSLDPRMTIGVSMDEPLKATTRMNSRERKRRIAGILDRVGLGSQVLHRYPHELSGGQLQRICIARALAPGSRLLVLDEPVASLDPLTRNGILDLLETLRRDLGLSCLLVAHSIEVVRRMSSRMAVMLEGRFIETGRTSTVLSNPLHPYTAELLKGSERSGIWGEETWRKRRSETGCCYAGRCRFFSQDCGGFTPVLHPVAAERQVACIQAPGVRVYPGNSIEERV